MALLMLFLLKVSLWCLTATSQWSCTALRTLSKGYAKEFAAHYWASWIFYLIRILNTASGIHLLKSMNINIFSVLLTFWLILLLTSLCIWIIFSLFSVHDWEVNSWKTEFTSWRQNRGRFPIWYSSKYSDHRWVCFFKVQTSGFFVLGV